MTQVTEAVFTGGVLKPEDQLVLREAQRVRLIIEPLEDEAGCAERSAALDRLFAGIQEMEFYSREPLPSRDELHDRP